MHDLYRWLAPKADSKKRRVLDRLLAARGGWVTGSQLNVAFGKDGWAWDGAVAQLREKLRQRGGDIVGQGIEGRDEYRYRLVLPSQVLLERHLARTNRVFTGDGQRECAERGTGPRGTGGAFQMKAKAEGRSDGSREVIP